MKLIEDAIDETEGLYSFWLSEEPKGNEIGLKLVLNLQSHHIVISEEDKECKEYNSVLIGFEEIRGLKEIINQYIERRIN